MQPDTTLESNHLVIADEAGQQLLEGLTIQCTFNANIAADHGDMAVVVMAVVVVIVIVVVVVVVVVVVMIVMGMGLGSWLVLQSQHNGCLHLSLRHRKQSGTLAHFALHQPLHLSHR